VTVSQEGVDRPLTLVEIDS